MIFEAKPPRILFLYFILIMAIHTINAQSYVDLWDKIIKKYGFIAEKFTEYQVILSPDKNQAEWWAGAPSVVQDSEGIFWLACRMRTADAPRGLRGYEIRILRSLDGIHFQKVKSIRREDLPIPGFERPALVIDPHTRLFKLYGCGPWKGKEWSIFKFEDAENPAKIKPASAYPVIQPVPKKYDREITVLEYKDPFIIYTQGQYHCYVTGYIRRNERIFHFVSSDGENWEKVKPEDPQVLDLDGWHNFFIRPAGVLPLGVGYLFIYEGSKTEWYDPVYNIATGLGYTFDLHHVIDLTPEEPLVVTTTPSDFFCTWRYSHWIYVGEEVWVYAEVVKENLTHEIRLYRIKR